MQRNQRITLALLVLLAGAAWIRWSAGSSDAEETGPAPQAGFPAPGFALESLSGDSVILGELRGVPVVLNFWATWCPPCRAEMRTIERVYQEYRASGLVILAVNATYQDDPVRAAEFPADFGLTYPILMDRTGALAAMYQVRSLPTTFFIDRRGIIREIVVGGPMAEALLRTRIDSVLP